HERRAAGHKKLQPPAIPSLARGGTKLIYPAHQTLAFKGADGRLVRDREKNAHRPIRRGKWLLLFNRVVFCKRLERRRNQTERIEGKLELRPWRACFDLLTQSTEAIANFLRLQDRHRLIENVRLQVQEQRHRDRLEISNSVGRGHRRTG